MLLVTCSISKLKNILSIFKTNNTFKAYYKFETFSKDKHFERVLIETRTITKTFSKYFQKPHKAYFQTKSSDLASN